MQRRKDNFLPWRGVQKAGTLFSPSAGYRNLAEGQSLLKSLTWYRNKFSSPFAQLVSRKKLICTLQVQAEYEKTLEGKSERDDSDSDIESELYGSLRVLKQGGYITEEKSLLNLSDVKGRRRSTAPRPLESNTIVQP
tara:strand:- start:258 stop:668 length:411 start_codon:yes stop_codon:yes gene_type:complete